MRAKLILAGGVFVAIAAACGDAEEAALLLDRSETSATTPETREGEESPSAPSAPPASADPDADASAAAPDANDASDADAPVGPRSHFACKMQGPSAYRPYYLQAVDGGAGYKDYSATPKGLLRHNAMTTKGECDQALAAANDEHGVICSRTGLDGWKPTLYTGTVPGRADFGYLGGSSITVFADCLKATGSSSTKGVCYWGGSAWYVSPIDHEGISLGPYPSVDACITHTK